MSSQARTTSGITAAVLVGLGLIVVGSSALSRSVSDPTLEAADRSPGGKSPAIPQRESAWYREARRAVERARDQAPVTGKARNVVLFVGDGMGIATVTAARILEGQRNNGSGEENALSFEKLPYTALVKTYNTDQQVADSAGTMTAMVTGVKCRAGVLSVDERAPRGDFVAAKGRELLTILEWAEQRGLSTGVVTTTRVTHATPGACYAHTPERDWESDANLPDAARAAGFPDIARQLIEFPYGDGLEVAMGGGRMAFLPNNMPDPEYPDKPKLSGKRLDGRDLTKEWMRRSNAAYVWNKAQFEAVQPAETSHLLGLFEPDHMQYEHGRRGDGTGEPALHEMTAKAIDILSRNPQGYFLMVEGGRIDHAHHLNNPYRALDDTIEFARAVRAAVEKTNRQETLIIVTADHSHTMTIAGYGVRGNPILGKVIVADPATGVTSLGKDELGLPYTVLSYANGPGYTGASKGTEEGTKTFPPADWGFKGIAKGRPDLTLLTTELPDYVSEATVPLESETHGGEDVPLYADGPQAHLFHGAIEQNVVFHVMVEAYGWSP